MYDYVIYTIFEHVLVYKCGGYIQVANNDLSL